MRRLIVGTEKNLSQLESRLFRRGLSRASLRAALTALKKANPQVNMDLLKPGMVLTIPDRSEFNQIEDVSMDDVASVGAIANLFAEVLEEAGAKSAAILKESKAEQSRLSKLLRSKEVTHAAKDDPELAAEVEATQVAIEAQAQLDKTNGAATKKAIRQWTKDLDEVRALLPD